MFIHEFLLQWINDSDRLAVVGDDQWFAGDDLFQTGGEVVFQIGHTGRFHMARIARFLTEANEENEGEPENLKFEIGDFRGFGIARWR